MPDGRVFIAGGAQLDYEIVNIDTYESQIIKNTIQEEKPLIQTGTDHPKLFADETTGNPVSVEGTRINYFDLKTLARISFRGWAKGWINHKDIIVIHPYLKKSRLDKEYFLEEAINLVKAINLNCIYNAGYNESYDIIKKRCDTLNDHEIILRKRYNAKYWTYSYYYPIYEFKPIPDIKYEHENTHAIPPYP